LTPSSAGDGNPLKQRQSNHPMLIKMFRFSLLRLLEFSQRLLHSSPTLNQPHRQIRYRYDF
jgi:hypothetical protein